MKIDEKALIISAIEVQKKSYSPYSNFCVGAALLTKSGEIYQGCNIESASYSPTNCAERTAFFKAVSEGKREFLAIAVVGGFLNSPEYIPEICAPCGVCRQVMMEFCKKDFTIILAKSETEFITKSLEELLPLGFGPKNLNKLD